MRFFLLFALLLPLAVLSQNKSVPMGAGQAAPAPPAPTQIHASDGVYDKFVLIRWENIEKTTDYRLFRATSAAGASMKELTKSWQKSTWFCDYSAEKGRDYYYAVLASDGSNSTPLSRFDKGFLKKEDKVAQDESLTAVTPDKYAIGQQVFPFMLVSEVDVDSAAYAKGSNVRLRVGLQNLFDEPSPRTELKIYLSADASWDFEDKMLFSKTYSGFPASLKAVLHEVAQLPAELLPGEYYMLVVAAPEGNILNAKTGWIKINIVGQ